MQSKTAKSLQLSDRPLAEISKEGHSLQEVQNFPLCCLRLPAQSQSQVRPWKQNKPRAIARHACKRQNFQTDTLHLQGLSSRKHCGGEQSGTPHLSASPESWHLRKRISSTYSPKHTLRPASVSMCPCSQDRKRFMMQGTLTFSCVDDDVHRRRFHQTMIYQADRRRLGTCFR